MYTLRCMCPCYSCRMLESVDSLEKSFIRTFTRNSSGSSHLYFHGPSFAVSATRLCSPNKTETLPGSSFYVRLSSDLSGFDLNTTTFDSNHSFLINDSTVNAAVLLRRNFAEKITSGNAKEAVKGTADCAQSAGVVFHVLNGSNLFLGQTGGGENSKESTADLRGRKEVNTLVVSATLSSGLNSAVLKEDVELFFKQTSLKVKRIELEKMYSCFRGWDDCVLWNSNCRKARS